MTPIVLRDMKADLAQAERRLDICEMEVHLARKRVDDLKREIHLHVAAYGSRTTQRATSAPHRKLTKASIL